MICDVYKSVVDYVKSRKPDLLKYITAASFGFITGIEFRESMLVINDKCKQLIKPNMTFVITLGAQNFPNPTASDPDYRTASIFLSDTVLIAESGPCEVLTALAKNRLRSNSIHFRAQGEEQPKNQENVNEQEHPKRSVILQEQTRVSYLGDLTAMVEHFHTFLFSTSRPTKTSVKTTSANWRRLWMRLQRLVLLTCRELKTFSVSRSQMCLTSLRRNSPTTQRSTSASSLLVCISLSVSVAYRHLLSDKKHDTVILPIFGMPVPFHISMLKNTSMANEGDYTYLRINFTHPGSQIGKNTLLFPNPLADFVKEMTFRSSNTKEPGEMYSPSLNLQTAYRLIKEVQKRFRTMEAEQREKEGAVKQDKLIVSNSKNNPKLKEIFVRPNIISKRVMGVLEAHSNGRSSLKVVFWIHLRWRLSLHNLARWQDWRFVQQHQARFLPAVWQRDAHFAAFSFEESCSLGKEEVIHPLLST